MASINWVLVAICQTLVNKKMAHPKGLTRARFWDHLVGYLKHLRPFMAGIGVLRKLWVDSRAEEVGFGLTCEAEAVRLCLGEVKRS